MIDRSAWRNPGYGWQPSTKRFARQHQFTATPVPDLIDLSAYKPAVINQGQVGRCSGCGTGGMISGHLAQLGMNAGRDFLVSPDDLYNLGRDKEGTLAKDVGAEPYDVLTMAQEYGIVPYADWPMGGFDTENPTSPAREAEAIKYPNFTPYQIDVTNPDTALTNILDAMAGGRFINMGFVWFGAWENYSSGLLPAQTLDDPIVGGHDTFLFAADVKNRFFWGQNSWGTGWGSGNTYPGCYMLSFDMIPVLAKISFEAEYVTFGAAPTPVPQPQPSACKIGNGVAKAVNLIPRVLHRHGRFTYMNWG